MGKRSNDLHEGEEDEGTAGLYRDIARDESSGAAEYSSGSVASGSMTCRRYHPPLP